MKLNPDSIRAILIYIEENQQMRSPSVLNPLNSASIVAGILKIDDSSCGTEQELRYAIKQLSDSSMIYAKQVSPTAAPLSFIVIDITPKGHEFLANIQNEDIWNKTKDKAKIIGSFSLRTLTTIASSVVSSLINKNIGC